jgi:hypothetical protein
LIAWEKLSATGLEPAKLLAADINQPATFSNQKKRTAVEKRMLC